MPIDDDTSQLLQILIQVIARAAVPLVAVQRAVGTRKNQVRAFNLCDGRTSLTEIANKTKIHKGNLSKTSRRWVEDGVAFRIGEGKNARLLHVYPYQPQTGPQKSTRNVGRRHIRMKARAR